MQSSIKRIQAANIDGRAQSPRHIQRQLANLHNSLVQNAAKIRTAIRNDSHNSSIEIEIEYYLALSALKEQYTSIDFEQSIDQEYNLAKKNDSPSRRVAAGIVYIVPSSYTPFFSVIAPLSAAIAAGNCVVVELKTTLSEVNALLRKSLASALDADTFAIVERKPEDADFMNTCVQVLQSETEQTPAANSLVSPCRARVVAVVDRSADVEAAAKSVVKSRFGFRGRSPYAPDIVLVNEFKINDFSNAIVQESTKYVAGQVTANGSGSSLKPRGGDSKGLTEEERREEGTVVIVSGASGSIVHVKSRTSSLVNRKISEPLLILHSISSLDDAIDFANKGDTLLASYLFAAPATAKYLGQFIDAHISCVNQIPADLLVGPASPLNHAASIHSRYSKAMFETPRPQFIQTPARSQTLGEILDRADQKKAQELRAEALAPLPSMNQRDGASVGFFHQGLNTGLAVLAVPVVTGTAALGYFAWTAARVYLHRR